MTLDWPLAFVLVIVIFLGFTAATTPAYRRARLQRDEMKAKHNEQYETLAADYAKLARELREAQAAMQADLATVSVGVASIEAMMRDVS